jgi:hypothetical protein
MAQTAACQFFQNMLPDCNASITSNRARLNGNSHRNCEDGPIFDLLRPDLKERLGALVRDDASGVGFAHRFETMGPGDVR